jgi:hypothetical protein
MIIKLTLVILLFFALFAFPQSKIKSELLFNQIYTDSLVSENGEMLRDSVQNLFKPERVIFETAAGALTGIGAGIISLVTVFAVSPPNIINDDSDVAPFLVFASVNAGFALGVYLAASKYNSQTKYYNYLLVGTLSATGAYFLARGSDGAGWAALVPFGLTILYSNLDYPSQIKINTKSHSMHGQVHNNITLSIPFN